MRIVETTQGPIPVWGAVEQFSPERPLLLVIRGAFAEPDHLLGLTEALPHIDVAFVHLPGMHSPHISAPSIAAFARAYDEVALSLFGERKLNVLGLSMGGLAAFAMRHPSLRAIIAADTALTMEGLWPLRNQLRIFSSDPHLQEWIWNLFGVASNRIESRNYTTLLDHLVVPTRLLIGSIPLEPERAYNRLPSLVSEADRATYRAHPMVGTTLVDGAGHNIPLDGQAALFSVIYRWLAPPPHPTSVISSPA